MGKIWYTCRDTCDSEVKPIPTGGEPCRLSRAGNPIERPAATSLSHYRIGGRGYDEVAPGLFVGPAPTKPELLVSHFNAVLDCREGSDHAATYPRLGIAYRRLPFGDDGPPPAASRLDPALTWLDNQLANGKRCLIHCRAGINRGPFVACAYFLPECEGDISETLKHLKRCRPEIRISAGLLASLTRG